MEMKVASQGGQVNLSTVKNPEIKQIAENKDVVEAVSAKGKDYKKEDVIKAIDKLNEFLKDEHTYEEYSIHEKLGDVMVKIISEDTKEVIMECPPKKILDLVAKMMELVGVAIDKKA